LTFEEVSLGVVSAEDATVIIVFIFRLVTYLLGRTHWSSSQRRSLHSRSYSRSPLQLGRILERPLILRTLFPHPQPVHPYLFHPFGRPRRDHPPQLFDIQARTDYPLETGRRGRIRLGVVPWTDVCVQGCRFAVLGKRLRVLSEEEECELEGRRGEAQVDRCRCYFRRYRKVSVVFPRWLMGCSS
jgi:hypothetical protein